MNNKKMNILFIMADQMAAPILPIYNDNSPIIMPNFRKLANNGVFFKNAYCNSPLCAPSRFSLVSGRLPSKIKAWDNAANLAADVPTYAHYLRILGYQTALAGKMHFCGPDQLHGFEERLTTDIYPADYGWTVNWDEPEVRLSWYHNMSSVLDSGPIVRTNQLDFDEEVMYKSKQYLYDYARSDSKRPFCLTVSMTHPHDPYNITKKYWDLYENVEIKLPKINIEQKKQDPHSKRILKIIDLWGKKLPDNKIKDARRSYFGSCSYIDDNIGILLKTLEECNLIDNTIIIFASDHGDMLGERGLWYKMHWFEMSLKIPLIIYAPKLFSPKVIEHNVSSMDLLSTFVDLAEGESIKNTIITEGKSFYPLIKGESINTNEVIGEYMGEGTISPLIMIKRNNFKFMYSKDDPPMLYDLANDKYELNNLATNIKYKNLVDNFIKEINNKWDINDITREVLESQRQRRIIYQALTQGKYVPWDYQPFFDASTKYMRNNIKLDDLERMAKFPR